MNVNCSFNCPTNLQGQRLRETVTLIKLSSLGWRENNWEQKVRNREREREREETDTHEQHCWSVIVAPHDRQREKKNLLNTSGQSRMICFAMSSSAHVRPRPHVFFLSEQKHHGRPRYSCSRVRGRAADSSGVRHLLELWSRPARQNSVNNSHAGGKDVTSTTECVLVGHRVVFSSDTAVVQCIYKMSLKLKRWLTTLDLSPLSKFQLYISASAFMHSRFILFWRQDFYV